MGKIFEVKINKFYRGISDDERQQRDDVLAFLKHFDNITYPNTLIPNRDFVVDGTSTMKLANFLYDDKLYGLGAVSGTNRVKIFEKDSPTGTWTASASASDTAGARNTKAFVAYKGSLFGGRSVGYIWRYIKDSSPKQFLGTWKLINSNNLVQPHIAKDDILYFPYDNKIASWEFVSLSDSSFNSEVLKLPEDESIIGVDDWKDKMVIGVNSSRLDKSSKMYIWDLVSDDVDDVIEWGEGSLRTLGTIGNTVIGISAFGGSTYDKDTKIEIRVWNGGEPELIKTIRYTGTNWVDYPHNAKGKNSFYFAGRHSGEAFIYQVGRLNSAYPISVSPYLKVPVSPTYPVINGFSKIRDYFWISCQPSGGNDFTPLRTNDQSSYSATSVVLTQKYHGSSFATPKQLKYVVVSFPPLPTSGKIKVEYSIDSTSNWVVLDSCSTTNSTYLEIGKELNGNSFSIFREVQFKITSINNAKLSEVRFGYEELNSALI